MDNLVGVVNKPQFDTDVFIPGKAIHIQKFAANNGHKLEDVHGLIGRVTPLTMVVWTYDDDDYDVEGIEISIKSVVSGEYKLALLKEDN